MPRLAAKIVGNCTGANGFWHFHGSMVSDWLIAAREQKLRRRDKELQDSFFVYHATSQTEAGPATGRESGSFVPSFISN